MRTLFTVLAVGVLGVVIVLSCSDDSTSGGDAGPSDAPRSIDAHLPDARPAVDARLPDARLPDARLPDARPAVDARLPDARPVDAARMPDARPAVDAGCRTSGQSCSIGGIPCCNGLSCVLPTGAPCAAGAVCTCQ
jgi:hypothetical protein